MIIRKEISSLAIQMLEYHKKYIPRRDSDMKRVNVDFTESLKSARKSIEGELVFANQMKKKYGGT